MGFFDKPENTGNTDISPLTKDRVAAYLRSEGYNFAFEGDTPLHGFWDENLFFFLLLGDDDVFQVRGIWKKTLPVSRRGEAMMAANDWNRDHAWPKMYVRVDDEMVNIVGETQTNLSAGVSNAQIGDLVECGIGTGCQAFDHFTEVFPDAAERDTD